MIHRWNGCIETAECIRIISRDGVEDPHCEIEVQLQWWGPPPEKFKEKFTGNEWRYLSLL
ncbi:MAG: hypothetical protein EOP45_12600 [Sphingobacteriaceae bacterium]|nr:MAG: hypothetical protein EOP45_12600 [Sphingobacteriaceae bacterium]